MPRYEKAPAAVGQIVERMMDRYHPQLRDAKVTIECLLAFPTTDKNGDSSGPALKHAGYPVAALVKIIGLKERTAGRSDVEIVIDGEKWDERSELERDALIDHELEHLELKTDKDGALVRDDLERPRLKIRKHDVQVGWFDAIVRRHGRASYEFQQWEEIKAVNYQQRWLPYLDEPDQTPVKAEPILEAKPVSVGPSEHDDLKIEIETGGQKAKTTLGGLRKAAGRALKEARGRKAAMAGA
jgi:hypothetical protein